MFQGLIALLFKVAMGGGIAAVLWGITKTSWFKGRAGEWKIRWLHFTRLSGRTYQALHDVTLNSSNGTTLIDHILVSKFGVFIIETKNYGGNIYGRAEEATWTQKFYQTSHTFQNPIRQNYKHVATVAENFGVPLEKIHSIVVFVGQAQFKTEMPANVVHLRDYVRLIRTKKTILLTDEQVESLVAQIERTRLARSWATNRQHVKNLKARYEKSAQAPVGSACPVCGAGMVERVVKSGERAGARFWGCSTYPKCRGRRPI
jgi:restriction system protein